MTSPSREAFEVHIRAKYQNQRVATLMLERMDGEHYISKSIDCQWASWQAAIQHARDVAERCRSAQTTYGETPISIAHDRGVNGCADAIKEALK